MALDPGDNRLKALTLEKFCQDIHIRLADFKTVERKFNRHIILEQHKFAANTRQIRVCYQRLAPFGLLNLLSMFEQAVEIAVFRNEQCRRLDPNTGNPRYVVDRISGQRLNLDNLVRADAEFLLHGVQTELAVSHGVKENNLVLDQLHQILVGGDDRYLGANLASLASVSRNQVISFISGQVHGWDIECFDRIAAELKLRNELLRRRWTMRLVFRIYVVTKSLAC